MFSEAMKCKSNSKDNQDYTIEGLPDIRVVPNALYLPKNPHRDQGYFGIFDRYGRLVNECSMFWHKDNILSSHPRETKISQLWDYHEIDSAVYCGYIGLHYGHVLLDFVSRLWFIKQNLLLPKKYLIHSHYTKEEILSKSWFCELIALIGIDPNDIILFDIPIKIKTLYAPNPGCEADSYVYTGFTDFCNQVGDDAIQGIDKIDYPVYLSRRKLSYGSLCLDNEDYIVDYLIQRGVKEIFPERLSIREQISIFSGKYPVLGISGSAFHTSVFSRKPKAVGIHFGPALTETFFAIDRANHADIDYFYAKHMHSVEPSRPGFPRTIKIENPEKFMSEVFECWEIKVKNIPVSSEKKSSLQGDEFFIQDHAAKWIKIMKHNGEIVSDSSFGEDRISCMAKIIQNENGAFIMADHSIGFPIFAADKADGQRSIAVKIDGAHIMLDDGRYLRSPAIGDYTPVDFTGNSPSSWEKFTLHPTK